LRFPFKRAESRALPRPENELPLLATYSGTNITSAQALAIGDVWAAVRVLADAASSLPLHVYRKTVDGRIFLASPATPWLAMSMWLLPVVRLKSARGPSATLFEPVVLNASACRPIARFSRPVLLSASACRPVATSSWLVVLWRSASRPVLRGRHPHGGPRDPEPVGAGRSYHGCDRGRKDAPRRATRLGAGGLPPWLS